MKPEPPKYNDFESPKDYAIAAMYYWKERASTAEAESRTLRNAAVTLTEQLEQQGSKLDTAVQERDAALLRLSACEMILRRLQDWPSVPVDFSAAFVTSGRAELVAALNELHEIKQAASAAV